MAFKSLTALANLTNQKYDLTIWYDTCGRGVDLDFFHRLMRSTDDVVLLTKNHGTSGALGYGMLYTGGDHFMVVLADTVVRPGYLERFSVAFERFEKLACAGSFRNVNTNGVDFLVNDKEFMPDGIQMFSREAINDVGGICPQFKGMGMENREWHDRAAAKGWNLVTCAGIMDEVGTTHDGRNMNPNADAEIKESVKTYLPIKDGKYQDFTWWKYLEKGRN